MSDYVRVSRQQLESKSVLGRGGFSTVFRVIWKRPEGNIEVAAKRLNEIDDRELNVLAKLKHEHIVQLLGVVNEGMDFILILELCEYGSLRSYLDKQKGVGLSTGHLLEWIEQAALPIQYLNENNIVHKDIKAANYLISSKSILKLSDFGLAKNLDKTQSNATARGTWAWMAPELLKDGKLSITFDIYAYGMTVWELATTQIPFKDQEYQWIVLHVCRDRKRPSIPHDCPRDVRELIEQCWQQDRRNRPDIERVVETVKKMKETYSLGQSLSRSSSHIPKGRSKGSNGRTSTSAPEPSTLWSTDFPFTRASSSPVRQKTANLEDATRWQPRDIERLHSYLSISPESWAFERRFGHNGSGDGTLSDARGIAINNSNGSVIVADRDQAKAKVYDPDGNFRFAIDARNGLERGQISRPSNVAVVLDGQSYFVTDETSKVKKFGSRGAYMGSFYPVAPNGVDEDPRNTAQVSGLAIDENGNLLVGVANKKYISIHSKDRSHRHLRSIRVAIEPYNLAGAPDNTIIVSSYTSHKVQRVSADKGTILATFSPPGDIAWSPYGVCCNGFLLLVCNWATDKNKGIHFFTLDGAYLGCVIPLLDSPKGIAMSEWNDKLFVTEVVGNGPSKGVKVYRRK